MTEEQKSSYIKDTLANALAFKTPKRIREMKEKDRIFGLPYRFTGVTDYRPWEKQGLTTYGRQYMSKIIAEAPVVQFVPGLPSYMPGMDNNEKSYIEAYIKASSDGIETSGGVIEKILGTDARYYDFVPAYAQYTRYVNMLCRMASIYMGIGDKSVPGTSTKYKNYDWGKWSNINYTALDNMGTVDTEDEESFSEYMKSFFSDQLDKLKDQIDNGLFNTNKYIRFYVEPGASVSESLSNSTTESKVASLFDTISPLVRELAFLSGGDGGMLTNILGYGESGTGTAGSILDNVSSALSSQNSATMSQIIGQASHVLTGSNVIFPELWSDSSYRKTYSFSIDLLSPYGDRESIFLSIIVPLMHLISLSYPKQTSANSFASPFLVKVYSAGWFSSDLAIVSSIQIDKGGDGNWTVEGFPTEVKVTLSVDDLYSSMSIPPSTSPQLFFKNTSLVEYLAVTCGVDISSPQIDTKMESILTAYFDSVMDIPNNIADNIRQRISNWIRPFISMGSL